MIPIETSMLLIRLYVMFACVQVARMLAENDWISSEKHLFGQPNTAYDFKTNNPKEAGQRLKRLEETKDKLERNVNRRAMNMLSEAEERVRPLTSLVTSVKDVVSIRTHKTYMKVKEQR